MVFIIIYKAFYFNDVLLRMCKCKSFGEKAGKEGRWMNIYREKKFFAKKILVVSYGVDFY